MAEKVEPIQELLQIALNKGFEPPTYEIVETENKSFKCLMKFFAYTIEAKAPTKDQSLKVCCSNMLIFWKCPDEFKSVCTRDLNVTIHYDEFHKAIEDEKRKKNEASKSKKKSKSEIKHNNFHKKTLTPVSYLYEYAAKTNNKSPEFTEVAHPNEQYSVVCRFMGRSCESECMASKKAAKHDAALKMIDLIGLDIPSQVKSSSSDMAQTNDKKKNYVGILQDLAIKQNEVPPLYQLVSKSGPQHSQEFEMKCTYMQISRTGCGKTKKEAKSLAAALVLSQLQISG